MEVFLRILQGSYAYLLIFQILVVSGLVLALILLIVRRTRDAYGDAGAVSAGAGLSGEAGERVAALEAKLNALEEENNRLKNTGEKGLKEKVKYLESKLLEYEILQEEIGALSTLKHENEQLKEQLLSARQAQVSAPVPAAPAAIAPPSAPRVSTNPVPAAAPAPTAATTAILFDAPPAASASSDTAPSAQSTQELESLLAQIDSLTSTSEKR